MSLAGALRLKKRGGKTLREAVPTPPSEGDCAQPSREGRSRKAAVRPRADPAALLAWYDRHRRKLPWRTEPGETVDPYRVWLSEIMLQQTGVRVAAPYYAKFLARWPDIRALAAAPLEDVLAAWAGLGYYARARNLHACAGIVVARHYGRFPSDPSSLQALPGVGRYTAAAIAAIAFDWPAVPVDGNIARVLARLHAVADPRAARSRIQALADAFAPEARAGDFAQALMDLGATVCTPRRPSCACCPWRWSCAATLAGQPEAFAPKRHRRKGRLRRGAAFLVRRSDGAVLVRTRPASGLLGGTTEVPTTAWSTKFDRARALDQAPQLSLGRGRSPAWQLLPQTVAHAFTHFRLELTVYAALVPTRTRAPDGMRFLTSQALNAAALSSVMRKVIRAAVAEPG